MRLGIVPYLNCLPLVDGLDCEIYKAPPSHLSKLAKQEDIILAPIVAAFVDPGWHLLEGVGIGSFGPVETVKLFFKNKGVNIQNIKTIGVDSESETSVALLKVLLAKKYERRDVVFIQAQDEPCEGNLLIGDKVWDHVVILNEVKNPVEYRDPSALPQDDKRVISHFWIDLGKEWSDWTKLPFVYACWMTKNREVGREWKDKLVLQAKENLANLETLAQQIDDDRRSKILNYWRQLCYEIEPREKEGIELFQEYWAQMEGKPIHRLQWIL